MKPQNEHKVIDKHFGSEIGFASYCFQRDNAPDIKYYLWSVIYPSYNLEHFEICYKFKPSLN